MITEMISNPTTTLFGTLIAIMLIWGCLRIRKTGSGNPFMSVVTNIGMLGTFLGIYIGLRNFDVKNIDDSIPELLEGMKLAFITSIFGIGAYIILKCVPPPKDAIPPGDEAETMIKLLRIIAGNGDKNYDLIKNVEKSISGDGETTLLTQIQKLRTTTSDNMNELNKSFKEFAEKQADNNSKALIEALESVMRDFNAKINEQFGDNFKRLNEAVGKMLEWQDKYKEHVEKMTEHFEIALKGIAEAKDVVVTLSKEASIYQETSIKLNDILNNVNTDLAGIDEMAKNAKNAFPIIQQNLEALTNEFTKTVNQALGDIKNTVENSSKESNNMLILQRDGINKQIASLEQSHKELETRFEELIKELNDKYAKTINEHFSTFDKQLQDELNRVMTQLGQNLVSISEKFVQDYTIISNTIIKLETELKKAGS